MSRYRIYKPVTEVIPNCPVCGKVGQVTTIRSTDILTMACECGYKWKSLSSECKCGELTGFAVAGLCSACYRAYIKSKGVA
ncbi:hypothetical protein SPSIL_014840 [Sporomusa silvacetica DSM 10669]|uniref:Uncharacterized protein n=1 Tax=Sporomusa silvacetica DSM 10669 TaxID=1123289 RepID=A0ABZ3II81_9FIRM|nr:hypothetical protein [Sporomusa silvacetica]OZC21546.1 hypothetical protein SPSIL_09570 [Sporomusa silvacetica DSM 10669]